MRKTWWVISAIILLAVALSYCGSDSTETSTTQGLKWLNHHDTVKYVGMAKCQQCHSDKHKTFIHTGMGQSFDLASRSKSAAKFHQVQPVYDRYSDLYYRPFWEDSSLFILEFRLKGEDTVHKRLEKIDYIVGSGQHTNSHIFSINGFLYQAPLTWYQQKGQWDLPPGYEDGQNSRFNRAIGFECMTCHNGYPSFDKNSTNRFLKVPDGIDCERCHGPGELHVKDKLAGNIIDIQHDTDFTIVNPSKLSWQLQVDVCQRCHLQGNAVLKEGKDFDDFKPGMPLRDVMQVFMPKYAGDNNDFIMASHAQRLQQSACFIKSNTGGHNVFTCISCHNPHVSVKVTGKSVFNSSCKSCHKQDTCKLKPALRLKENDNCVKCHMPANKPTDIPHVTVHDHFIRVPKKPSISKENKRFVGLYAVNDDNPTRVEMARAYLAYFEKFDRGNTLYLDSARNYLSEVQNPKPEFIRYLYLKGDFDSIASLTITKSFPDAWTNYRVGRAFHVLRKNEQALPFLQAAYTDKPTLLAFGNELAACLLELGKFERADQLLNELLMLQPKQVQTLNNAGYLSFLKGQLQEAKLAYEQALKLNPDYLPAILNLCDLYLRIGDDKQAKVYLKRAQFIEPENDRVIKTLQLLRNRG